MRAHRPPPLWFVVCLAVVEALAWRLLLGAQHAGHGGGGQSPDTQYAFFAFLITIASAIFKGLEVAGKVALTALSWSVKALWWFATTTANGLKIVGQGLLVGLKKSWEFFRLTYDRVLKPALRKFWGWFDKFRHWLDDTFGPVLDWLKILRDNVILFWRTWVRPWLDLIDVSRRMLRIFSALGLDWARRLDAKLGQLQELIDRPFRLVLGKINEVINLINRIVTVDGLIQRLALIRSLERDFIYTWRAAMNPWHRLLSEEEKTARPGGLPPKTVKEITADTRTYMIDKSGPDAALLSEMAAQWRIYLRN